MSLEQFWRSTPREVNVVIEAENRRRDYERDLVIYHAWHVAMFERQDKLPSLDTIFSNRKEPAIQSPESQLDWARAFVMMSGGKIIKREELNG